MLVLGTQLEWERSIYTFYTKFTINPGPPFRIDVTPDPQILFTLGFLWIIVASFPLLSSLAHFIIAFGKNKQYNDSSGAYRNGNIHPIIANKWNLEDYLRSSKKSFISCFLPHDITIENYQRILETKFLYIGYQRSAKIN